MPTPVANVTISSTVTSRGRIRVASDGFGRVLLALRTDMGTVELALRGDQAEDLLRAVSGALAETRPARLA